MREEVGPALVARSQLVCIDVRHLSWRCEVLRVINHTELAISIGQFCRGRLALRPPLEVGMVSGDPVPYGRLEHAHFSRRHRQQPGGWLCARRCEQRDNEGPPHLPSTLAPDPCTRVVYSRSTGAGKRSLCPSGQWTIRASMPGVSPRPTNTRGSLAER